MELAKQKYRQLTGREPGNLVVLRNGEIKNFIDQFFSSKVNLDLAKRIKPYEEFWEIRRNKRGYEVHALELHEERKGTTMRTYFEERDLPPGRLGHLSRMLEDGETLTLHFLGENLAELARKREEYLSPEVERVQEDASQLVVKVRNRAGLYFRPAIEIVRYLTPFEQEVYVAKQSHRFLNAKEINSLLALAPTFGQRLTFLTEGDETKTIFNGLEEMFRNKFGEKK